MAKELANAIRFLSMDAVEQAKSGHPGMPMGMADIAEVLWNDFLNHNPENPDWSNRDRFILSNGHGSMLLYALLHLTGYALSIEDLKHFRQLHSKTPGHPEVHDTPGVETTTGPLGQGLANAVGMAMAEARLAETFNRPGFAIVDHYTYVFLGDGCLMEGISHEACSFAGTMQLGKLIAFWDDNHVSIDGCTDNWFTDNTPARFKAYHWHVIENVDGHDRNALHNAIIAARAVKDKPSLICCRTTIAYGAPTVAGTCDAHGAPLGTSEIEKTRLALQWPYAPFEIPESIYQAFDARKKGGQSEAAWNNLFAAYQKSHPDLSAEFLRRIKGALPAALDAAAQHFLADCNATLKKEATRKSSLAAIEVFSTVLPELIGGSADLSGSNCTQIKNATLFKNATHTGNYLHYGVREFGMSAIMNGLALHGGLIPFGGTFLVFSDYARNAVRLAALMQQKVIFVYSHDSIGLGEDGPTHQPIEHVSSLRLIPGLNVWRPCDRLETACAWYSALKTKGPSALLLTRQNVQQYARTDAQIKEVMQGAYILLDCAHPSIILLATGSEVELAMSVATELNAKGKHIRVVSMPCFEKFKEQDLNYQEKVLPSTITKRIAIEAGCSDLWYKYVGLQGKVVGIDRFGFSAPHEDVYKALGITTVRIKQLMEEMV